MITLLCLSLVSAAPKRAKPIEKIQAAFDATQFEEAYAWVKQTDIAPLSHADKLRVLFYGYACAFYLAKQGEADAWVEKLLAVEPTYEVDAANNPPPLVEYFRQAKAARQKQKEAAVKASKAELRLKDVYAERERTLKLTGYGLMAGGGACVVTGIVLLAVAGVRANALNADVRSYNAGNNQTLASREALDRREAQIGAESTAALVLGGIGVAALVAGGVLAFKIAPASRVTLAPTLGGAALAGSF